MPFKRTENEYVYLQGKCKWFRPDQPDQWSKWSHVLYPDQPSIDKINKLKENTETRQGIKNILSKDDDGYYMRIGRKTKIEPRSGVPIPLRPPEVFDKDGKTPLRGVYVGNGSDITTKIEVYTYNLPAEKGKKGRAIRWESSRIDNLIPYDAPRDADPSERTHKDPARGLDPESMPPEKPMF